MTDLGKLPEESIWIQDSPGGPTSELTAIEAREILESWRPALRLAGAILSGTVSLNLETYLSLPNSFAQVLEIVLDETRNRPGLEKQQSRRAD